MEYIGTLQLFKEILDWRSIVDIFLLAAVLFFLYRTLLRLGTWKIVFGILAAALMFVAANILNLNGIKWIYSNLSNVALIALIIIFQPELRKFFERAVSVRRLETTDQGSELSGMIGDALFAMAGKHQGALMVFPGKEPIEPFTAGGYEMNALASFPLIMSIFDSHSPGHDGAVIVNNGRLTRFGVRLPVSQSAKLPEEYGTRHHAAMGLSEQTDALVAISSEERGSVSIFHKSEMRKVHFPEQIVESLRNHWQSTSSYPFKSLLGKMRWAVISQMAISLILAVVFWSTIIAAQGEFVERIFTVPVEYTSPAPNLALVGERKKELQLYVGGTKSNLDSLNPSSLSAKVDLSKFGQGTQSVFITRDHLRLPKGVNLKEVNPSKLELTLAKIAEHWAPIVPQLVGRLPEGVRIRSVEVKPEKVRVSSPVPEGGQEEIRMITTPIYIDGIREDTLVPCKIIAPPTIKPVGKEWPEIEVLITVYK